MEYLLSFFSLPVILSILVIIHIIKTNRDRSWIYIVLFLPVIGGVVYFFAEIIPDLLRHPRAERARRTFLSQFTARSRLARAVRELNFSPTFANRRKAADEYFAQGEYEAAIGLYTQCLKDFDADNMEVRLALAQSHFFIGRYEEALRLFRELQSAPSLFKKYTSDLFLARTLEKLGKTEEADTAYASLAGRYPGFEAYARYGLFLKARGQAAKAQEQFAAILEQYAILPRVNRRAEREWIRLARQERSRSAQAE